jgi:putative spermidine/putrescine transport system substrate-binding protein
MRRGKQPTSVCIGLIAGAMTLAACGSAEVDGDGGEPAAGGGDNSGRVLRVGLYGGTWMEGVQATAAKVFTEATGAQVEFVQGNPSDLATQVYAASGQGSEAPMDVIETDSLTQTQLAGRELLVPIDEYGVDDVFGDVEADPLNEGLAPPHCDWYLTLVYNVTEFEKAGLEAPTSWEALWAPELAGRVTYPDISVAHGPAMLAAAAGVATGDPEDLAAGIDKVTELDTYSVYKSSSDMQSDIANGNVWAAASADGRAWQLVADGQPVEVVYAEVPGTDGKKGPQAGQCFLDVVKGSENVDLAAEFIKASYSPEVQAEFARLTAYTPTSPAALDELASDPAWEERIQDPEEVVTLDWESYAKEASDLAEAFRRASGG